MAATTLATLDTPISRLRSAPMDRILAVEDEGALQKIQKRLFSSEGHEVDAAPDGEADLEKVVTPGLPLVIVSASSKLADKVLSPGDGRRRLRCHTVQPRRTCCASGRVAETCGAYLFRRRICF